MADVGLRVPRMNLKINQLIKGTAFCLDIRDYYLLLLCSSRNPLFKACVSKKCSEYK